MTYQLDETQTASVLKTSIMSLGHGRKGRGRFASLPFSTDGKKPAYDGLAVLAWAEENKEENTASFIKPSVLAKALCANNSYVRNGRAGLGAFKTIPFTKKNGVVGVEREALLAWVKNDFVRIIEERLN